MKKVLMKATALGFCLASVISCTKDDRKPVEDVAPPTSEMNDEVIPSDTILENQTRSSYCNNPVIEDFVIMFDRQVGSGFTFTHYWVEDWNGDGLLDMIAKNSNHDLWYYKGYAVNNSSSYSVPNITSDAGIGHWDYKFHSGVKVGNGWGNFVEFHPGRWNSDNKCDLMALHSNGTMYVYYFNGTSFYSSTTTNYPGFPGSTWDMSRKRIAVDLQGDGRSDLVEVNDPGYGTSDNMISYAWNGTSFNLSASQSGYDINDEYYFHDFSHDGKPDMIVRKSSGILQYRDGLHGSSYGFGTMKQVGTGWNVFSDIYPGDQWSLCGTAVSSITGRTSSGVFKTYLWNPTTKAFNPGVQVGTGWNFTHIWSGDLHPDINYRHDFLARDQYGRIYSYYTLLDMLYY